MSGPGYFFGGGGGGGRRMLPPAGRAGAAAGTGAGAALAGAGAAVATGATGGAGAAVRPGGGGGGRIDCGVGASAMAGGGSALGDLRRRAGNTRAASSPSSRHKNSGPRMPPETLAPVAAAGFPGVGAAIAHAAGLDRALSSGPILYDALAVSGPAGVRIETVIGRSNPSAAGYGES